MDTENIPFEEIIRPFGERFAKKFTRNSES